MKRFNWQLWAGFLVSIFTFLSYPLLFARFAVTRDFPWANLLLSVVALVLLFFGVRRAFAPDRTHPLRSKISGAVVVTLGIAFLSLFIFTAFIMARWLPASHGAPQVGQKAPDFTLSDTSGRQVSLSELLTTPRKTNTTPKGVLLIFYRGYW